MTSNQTSVSARLDLLDRLSRESADAPESRDFAPASLSDLERSSLADGVLDLLAHQEERVEQAKRKALEEIKQQAIRRAEQRAEARRWERDWMEENRRREFELRLQEAKLLALEESKVQISSYHEQLTRDLAVQARDAEITREITKISADREKKKWRRRVMASAIVALVASVSWMIAPNHVRSSASHKAAELWEEAAQKESSARARVAELEAEIQKRVYLSAGEKSLLEAELASAERELAEAEEARDSVDQKRPTTGAPGRLANAPTVAPKSTAAAEKKTDDGIRVASDLNTKPACNVYDPMCFDL